ncbi:MAG: hypothetical protein QXI38_04805, partial [Conexivisphaerales archaeon]
IYKLIYENLYVYLRKMDDFEPFAYTNELIPEEINKETVKILVKFEKRKYNKPTTIVQFNDTQGINIVDVAKNLKRKLACGGAAKGDSVILQGDHRDKVVQNLIDLGFKQENVVVE